MLENVEFQHYTSYWNLKQARAIFGRIRKIFQHYTSYWNLKQARAIFGRIRKIFQHYTSYWNLKQARAIFGRIRKIFQHHTSYWNLKQARAIFGRIRKIPQDKKFVQWNHLTQVHKLVSVFYRVAERLNVSMHLTFRGQLFNWLFLRVTKRRCSNCPGYKVPNEM